MGRELYSLLGRIEGYSDGVRELRQKIDELVKGGRLPESISVEQLQGTQINQEYLREKLREKGCELPTPEQYAEQLGELFYLYIGKDLPDDRNVDELFVVLGTYSFAYSPNRSEPNRQFLLFYNSLSAELKANISQFFNSIRGRGPRVAKLTTVGEFRELNRLSEIGRRRGLGDSGKAFMKTAFQEYIAHEE
jgi:hypothetical protein